MANPFTRLGQANMSRQRKGPDNMGQVQEAGVGVGYTSGAQVPLAIGDDDDYTGDNNPYRGIEPHGVHPNVKWRDVEPITPDDAVVEFEIPPADPEPIPVRIVQSGSRELIKATVQHSYATNAQSRIVNRDEKRKTCKISNLHATDTAWISPDSSVQPFTGYPIKAGAEFAYNAQGQLWVVSGTVNVIELAVYSETVYEE